MENMREKVRDKRFGGQIQPNIQIIEISEKEQMKAK